MEPIVTKEHSQSERAISAIVYAMLAGCSGIVLFAIQTKSFAGFYSVLGVGLLIACASVLTGGLAGFLFGIPKTLQQEKPETQPPGDDNKARAVEKDLFYQTNTNLEQISDWLTKIMVGVGLTQLTSLPEAFKRFAEFTAPGLGGLPSSKPFSVVLLVFYLICGFLISYLWTRLYLKGELVHADLAAFGREIAKVDSKISEIQKQAETDAKALGMVMHQINSGPGLTPVSQEDLNSAIMGASNQVRTQIYYQASDMRSKNWKERETKPVMERTIPIFRALIASDTEDIYYLNHGQLGFALKDQRNPDWSEAEKELTKAIQLRGDWREKGWLFFEFNRALCRINLDQAFREEKECDEETRTKILSDLKSAANAHELKDLISDDPVIKKWFSINKVRWAK